MLWRNGAIVALALVVAGPALAHFEILSAMTGFMLYAIGGVLGMIFTIGGAIAWGRGRPGGRLATGIAVLAALALMIPMAVSLQAGHPRINDVSTDLDDPPALENGEPLPPAFLPVLREHYADVASLQLDAPPPTVRAAALFAAQKRNDWRVTETSDGRIVGVATSGLFRFRDDFSVRVRAAEGGGSVVDVRSRSRDGQGDFGVNAARIRDFLAELERAVGEKVP